MSESTSVITKVSSSLKMSRFLSFCKRLLVMVLAVAISNHFGSNRDFLNLENEARVSDPAP